MAGPRAGRDRVRGVKRPHNTLVIEAQGDGPSAPQLWLIWGWSIPPITPGHHAHIRAHSFQSCPCAFPPPSRSTGSHLGAQPLLPGSEDPRRAGNGWAGMAAAAPARGMCPSVPGAPAGRTQPCQPQGSAPARVLPAERLLSRADLSAESSREMPVGTAPRLARSSGQAAERHG